jgi:hypothetical protein
MAREKMAWGFIVASSCFPGVVKKNKNVINRKTRRLERRVQRLRVLAGLCDEECMVPARGNGWITFEFLWLQPVNCY